MGPSDDHCPGCRADDASDTTAERAVLARQEAVARDGGLTRRRALQLAAIGGGGLALAPRLGASSPRATDLRAARRLAAPRPNWPVPPIITRSGWGANEALRKPGQVYDATVEKLVVHHTVTPTNPADPAAVLRGIYHTAVSGEYIDVQYHWLIDQHGRIYEGRWATDYPPGAPHTGERDGRNVRGGHAGNHNSRTIGVAFMGTYTSSLPPPVAVDALVTLLAWKCARWGIDPLGATPYVNGSGTTVAIPNICGHRDVRATACPGGPLHALLPEIRQRVAARLRDGSTGYWIASSDGQLFAYGSLPDQGDTRRLGIAAPIVGLTAHPSGLGYWMFGRDGGVFTFGYAQFFGSTGGMRLNAPVIGMAATPSGNGYWLVGRDGGVFTFGGASFHGSTGGLRLNAPVIGMTPTPTGRGYWLYARDGGIFSFGDARFYGSTGGIRLNKPIVAMAARPQGDGYWLVAEDGGVFAFGGAGFHGSAAAHGVRSPVVSMLPTTTGRGYVLLARDGSVYAFGDAPFFGSAAGAVREAVGLAGRLRP
jgi:hypothetical protein